MTDKIADAVVEVVTPAGQKRHYAPARRQALTLCGRVARHDGIPTDWIADLPLCSFCNRSRARDLGESS